MSYNNGKSLDISSINNIEVAINDFSEGNIYLEKLLIECYKSDLKTVACCKGHEEKENHPYITFSYCEGNEQFIYYITNILKDYDIEFRYNKNPKINSFFNLEFRTYDQNCFEVITNALKFYDNTKNYYLELPEDLKIYFNMVKSIQNSNILNSDNSEYFQFLYYKENDLYNYIIMTNNFDFNFLAKDSGFKHNGQTGFSSYYYIESKEREENNSILNNMNCSLNKLLNRLSIPLDIENKTLRELNIHIKHQDNDRKINLMDCDIYDTIEEISIKLAILKTKGINAYVMFNDIEVNNYKTDDPNNIKKNYLEQFNSNKFKR